MRNSVLAKPIAYDFRQASSLASDQVRELSDHLTNLCRALSRTVPESTGLPAQFSLTALEPATYDEYLDGLPESPILALCDLGPTSPPLAWQMDASVAFALMDAMLGGRAAHPEVREGELTTLERSLATAIIGGFLATFTRVWPSLRTVEPHVSEVRQNSGRLGAESLQQALMRTCIDCVVGENSGIMRIGIPALGMRPLLRQVHARGTPRVATAAITPQSLTQMGGTRLQVAVHIGHSLLSLEEVRTLRPGDVVLLDRGAQDPVDVAVGGVKTFRGISGLSNGRLAVRITTTADA